MGLHQVAARIAVGRHLGSLDLSRITRLLSCGYQPLSKSLSPSGDLAPVPPQEWAFRGGGSWQGAEGTLCRPGRQGREKSRAQTLSLRLSPTPEAMKRRRQLEQKLLFSQGPR